jgi:hypothetical protein
VGADESARAQVRSDDAHAVLFEGGGEGVCCGYARGRSEGLLARLTSSAREGFGDQQRAGASWMRADGNVFSHSAAQCVQCRAVQRRDVQPPLAAQMPGCEWVVSGMHACHRDG